MTEKEQHMIFQSDTCMVNDNMICWIKERKHRRRHFMGKAENGEIREVTANIWEDRKHHLWFPLSFTKYTVGNGRLYVNSGFLLQEKMNVCYTVLQILHYTAAFHSAFLEQGQLSFIPKTAPPQLSAWRISRNQQK